MTADAGPAVSSDRQRSCDTMGQRRAGRHLVGEPRRARAGQQQEWDHGQCMAAPPVAGAVDQSLEAGMASFEVVMGEARLSTFFNRICPSVAMPTRGGGSRGLPAQHDAQLIASPVTPAALLLNRGPATRVRSVRCQVGWKSTWKSTSSEFGPQEFWDRPEKTGFGHLGHYSVNT